MDSKKDFTLDPINFPRDKMNQLLKRLADSNQRIVPILDPGIKIDEEYGTYARGLSRGIFVKNPPKVARYGGKYFVGQVWPGNVHFIDFTHENASKFLSEELIIFFNQFDNLHVFAGLWLDMNEPSNFIDGYNYNFEDFPRDYASFSLNFPRYCINNGGDESPVYQKTIPMDSLTQLGTCYQTHNMYGIFESKVSYEAMKELNHPIGQARPFLLTRSTFPGSGRWTATWLGDNLSTFSQMALSIPGILQYGLAGIPMSGPDICGFLGEASEELCARWMALGAFYPFSRNHNSIESTQDQEPYNWKSVAHISRRYLQLRYSLHPYYYTLMHTAHVKGWPIWRPIFFYDASEEAKSIDDQVFIGSDLLLSPVLMESKRSLIVRLPKGEWYEWDTLNFIKTASNAIKVEYSAPIDFISLHLRAGAIILLQPSDKLTMFETRKADFKLLIALNTEGKARGCVYWDDGKGLSSANHTIEIFTEAKQGLGMNIYFSGFNESVEAMPKIKEITVLTAGRRMGRLREESWYNWSFLDSTGNFELKLAAFAGVTMNGTVNLKFE
jgi:alpha-glucosidase